MKNIDVRLLYILPSLLALVIAVTSLAYQFGNELIDIKNTCYTIFVSIPDEMTSDEMMADLDEKLLKYDLTGFTINLNTQGAFIKDEKLNLDNSLQISLMKVSKNTVYQIVDDLHEAYGETIMLQEYTVKVSYI